jgi:hypothetical protein
VLRAECNAGDELNLGVDGFDSSACQLVFDGGKDGAAVPGDGSLKLNEASMRLSRAPAGQELEMAAETTSLAATWIESVAVLSLRDEGVLVTIWNCLDVPKGISRVMRAVWFPVAARVSAPPPAQESIAVKAPDAVPPAQ